MLKIPLKIIVLTVLLLSIVPVAYAGTWSPSVEWGAQTASYAPDWGNTSMYEFTDSYGQLKVSPKARFNFTQSAIDARSSPNLCVNSSVR